MGRKSVHPAALAAALAVLVSVSPAGAAGVSSRGQVVLAPAYSEIPFGDQGRTANLTVTLSVRNSDRRSSIRLARVDYHNSQGALLRSLLAEPRSLSPLAAAEFVVRERDRSGGVSAAFLVTWESDAPVSPPVIESVMIGTFSTQGISFVSPGRVLDEKP